MFKEILACCHEEIANNQFFLDLAKSRSWDSISQLLEYVLISVGDVAHKVAHIDGDDHLKTVSNLMTGINTNHQIFEAVTLKDIEKIFHGLGYGNLGIKDVQEGQLRMVLAVILMLGIDEIAHFEETLIHDLNDNYHLIAKKLDPEISEIVSIYLRLKTVPVINKYMSKLINEKTANSNKGKTKPSKGKLFDGFIEWALALPEGHGYQAPIHAARKYCEIIKGSGNTESTRLAKQIAEKTPRNMCTKLDEYCKDKNVKNPLKTTPN